MENVDVPSEIKKLNSIRRQTRIWRSSLVVLAVVIVLACVLVMRNAVSGLAQEGAKRDLFVQKVGASMQRDILPQVQDVGAEAVQSVDFNKEIAQLNVRAPEVANASLKEARQLARNIPARGKKVLTQEFETAMQAQAATLRREFPDATEEQIRDLMDALVRETQAQVAEVTDSLFTPHITAMNGIVNSIDKITEIEGPAATADIPTWDMAFLIVDIARADFDLDEADQPTDAGKEKVR